MITYRSRHNNETDRRLCAGSFWLFILCFTLVCGGGNEVVLPMPDSVLPDLPNDAPVVFPDGTTTPDPGTMDPGVLPDTITPSAGPGLVLNMTELLDESGLNIQWDQNESGLDPLGGGLVYRLVFSFKTEGYGGVEWTHQARLYLPTEPTPGGLQVAVLQEWEVAQAVDPIAEMYRQYGADTARHLKIAVLIVSDLPPSSVQIPSSGHPLASSHPDCFDVDLEHDAWLDCGLRLVMDSASFQDCPFAAIARSYIRSVTAAKVVVDMAAAIRSNLPISQLDITSVMYGGAGLSGVAVRQALAVDPRASGSMSRGADIADLSRWNALQEITWPEGPFWVEPSQWSQLSAGSFGEQYRSTWDVAAFDLALIGKRLAIMRGTNDPRFPIGALDLYANSNPGEVIPMYIANYDGAQVPTTGIAHFRTLVSRVALGMDPPKVLISLDTSGPVPLLQATVSGCQSVEGNCLSVQGWITKYHGQADDADYRDVIWEPIYLNPTGVPGAFSGPMDMSQRPNNTAVFVEAIDQVVIDGTPGPWTHTATSRLLFAGEAYPTVP